MDYITTFLENISYKFPKGYPDMEDINDVKLLENELKNIGIVINELKTTPHWNERIDERGSILDIMNLPSDFPKDRKEVMKEIGDEVVKRATKLENLKDFPVSLPYGVSYKILRPVINHNGQKIPLDVKVEYTTKGVKKIGIGNTFVAIIDANKLVTLLLSPTDEASDLEKQAIEHREREKLPKKPIKVLTPTNYEFSISSQNNTTTQTSINPDELPYKLRTDYRKGVDFVHEKYGKGKVVNTSAGSAGKGDFNGKLDWIEVDFGKPYVSGGKLHNTRKIENIYTLASPMLSINQTAIQEAKQVGDIYHFTSMDTLESMRLGGKLELDISGASEAADAYFSFTRNPNLETLGHGKHNVRFKINGDKMSNKYKFEPYVDVKSGEDDFSYSKNSPDFEAEERISSRTYGTEIDIEPYIEEISLLDRDSFINYLDNSWEKGSKYYPEAIEYYDNVIKWLDTKSIPVRFIKGTTTASHRIQDRK